MLCIFSKGNVLINSNLVTWITTYEMKDNGFALSFFGAKEWLSECGASSRKKRSNLCQKTSLQINKTTEIFFLFLRIEEVSMPLLPTAPSSLLSSPPSLSNLLSLSTLRLLLLFSTVRRVGLINGLLGGAGLGGTAGIITHAFQKYGAGGLADKGEKLADEAQGWGEKAWKKGQEKVQEGKGKLEDELKK